ncbi:MAG: helix-turn-helix domain-containing protein [Pseudomonadales bacterium]
MAVVDKFRLLWLDLSIAVQEAELPPHMGEYCVVTRTREQDVVERLIGRREVDLLCLDYDYPDRRSLRLLQELKRTHPGLPMLMLTLQHSESLAVWAFRARVWDYLVKPISNNEIDRCFRSFQHMLEQRAQQPARVISMLAQQIPAEAAAPVADTADVMFLPAINYVEQHFRAKIRNEEVARLCHMSPFRFSRGFKAHFGVGFRDYVLHFRLREAKRMLENPNAVIGDVCYACGFSEPSYFSKMFRKHFNVSPSEAIGSNAPFEGGADADEMPTLTPLRSPRRPGTEGD